MVIFSLNQESIRLLSSFFCIILPQVERNTDVYILLIKVFLVIEKRMHSDIHVFLETSHSYLHAVYETIFLQYFILSHIDIRCLYFTVSHKRNDTEGVTA